MHICQIVNSSSNIEDNQNILYVHWAWHQFMALQCCWCCWAKAGWWQIATAPTAPTQLLLVLFCSGSLLSSLLLAAVGLIFTAPVTTTTTAMVTRAELMGLTCAYVTKTHLIQQHQGIDHNLVRTSNTHFVRHQEPTAASECHWIDNKGINTKPWRQLPQRWWLSMTNGRYDC